MTDRIFLQRMEFMGRHGVSAEERSEPQLIEVDIAMALDLRAAGTSDDLHQTVDYGAAFERCRAIVEERSFQLLEAIAEATAADLLATYSRIASVVVRVSKPGVPIDGVLESAGVEVTRERA
ncbi:MAG: dihydroneopterin aldolase [Candidatus Limnocylindrales bacterium]